jgi:D-aspartate ligase
MSLKTNRIPSAGNLDLPPAVVMNMFYTGLGIARSLGERGVPVIGLSSRRGHYGNYTRYAKTVLCPDSREEPEALLAFLLAMGKELGSKGVIFPTRDDDLVFLDRFRPQLEAYFHLVAAEKTALRLCLDKWETSLAAARAGVAAPRCWMLQGKDDLLRAAREAKYPCVLKPLEAHYWRQGRKWEQVGARKAIGVTSERELFEEYETVSGADNRALLQEMIPGGDDCLVIAACYMDRQSKFVTGFNTRKILQVPERFGTGCIVESVSRPELFEPAARLLQEVGFSGIAEVEFKWHSEKGEYQLIEINPRPWDQHRLGYAAGVDLMYVAYCEQAGLPLPSMGPASPGRKWIAEDVLVSALLRSWWHGESSVGSLLGKARGKRMYAIWFARDPLPALMYWVTQFLPGLLASAGRALGLGRRKPPAGIQKGATEGGRIWEPPQKIGKS